MSSGLFVEDSPSRMANHLYSSDIIARAAPVFNALVSDFEAGSDACRMAEHDDWFRRYQTIDQYLNWAYRDRVLHRLDKFAHGRTEGQMHACSRVHEVAIGRETEPRNSHAASSTQSINPHEAPSTRVDVGGAILQKFYCSLCQVQCSSVSSLQAHQLGAAHVSRLTHSSSGTGHGWCEVCGVTVPGGEQGRAHFTGKKHLKKAREEALETI